jgi:hypothetical protein
VPATQRVPEHRGNPERRGDRDGHVLDLRLANWNTTVPNGSHTLHGVASYGGGVSGTSPGVAMTVGN